MNNFFFIFAGVVALAGGGYLVGFKHGARFAVQKYRDIQAEVRHE